MLRLVTGMLVASLLTVDGRSDSRPPAAGMETVATKCPERRGEVYGIWKQIHDTMIAESGELPYYDVCRSPVSVVLPAKGFTRPPVAIFLSSEGPELALRSPLVGVFREAGWAIAAPRLAAGAAGAKDLRIVLNELARRNDIDKSQVLMIASGESCRAALTIGAMDFRVEGLVLIAPPGDLAARYCAFVPRRLLVIEPNGGGQDDGRFAVVQSAYRIFISPENFRIIGDSSPAVILAWARQTKAKPFPKGKEEPAVSKEMLARHPLPYYACLKVISPPKIDGSLSDPAWKKVPWTADFLDMITGETPPLRTRAKMLWDDKCLYVAIEMAATDIRGMIRRHDQPFVLDDDIEIFLDPDNDGRNYLDFEMNALGTVYDAVCDRMGGKSFVDWDLRGVRREIKVNGTLNCSDDKDVGWSIEWALPWAALADISGRCVCPPRTGDTWSLDFFRMVYHRTTRDGKVVIDPSRREMCWTWAVHGYYSMHVPERFGRVTFMDKVEP